MTPSTYLQSSGLELFHFNMNIIRGHVSTEMYTLNFETAEEEHQKAIPMPFCIPSALLTRIPYFATVIAGNFIEAQFKVFNLQHDYPQAVADVLLIALADKPVIMKSSPLTTKAFDNLIEAYILADKWGAEAICNTLIDCIMKTKYDAALVLTATNYLIKMDLQETSLCKLLQGLASDFVGKRPTNDEVRTLCETTIPEWDKDLLCLGLHAIRVLDGSGRLKTCAFHSHKTTKKCDQASNITYRALGRSRQTGKAIRLGSQDNLESSSVGTLHISIRVPTTH